MYQPKVQLPTELNFRLTITLEVVRLCMNYWDISNIHLYTSHHAEIGAEVI